MKMSYTALYVLLIFELLEAVYSHPICDIAASTSVGIVYPSWTCTKFGNPESNFCDWPGVSCVCGIVSSIHLQSPNIVGNGFIYFSKCCFFGIYLCIEGTIPNAIGSLSGISSLLFSQSYICKCLC